MTSIVITPFDPEHAEELKAFIENELDNADFEGEDVPSSVRLVDVQALEAERNELLAALKNMVSPSVERDPMLWHHAKLKASSLVKTLNETKGTA